MSEQRLLILELIDQAISSGARQGKACELLGVSKRTIQRWRKQNGGMDQRKGPNQAPSNKYSDSEKETILEIVNHPEYRDLSPKQIVPKLADREVYIGSESTIYRVLREAGQMSHRRRSKPATRKKPKELVATGPNQVWSWDITYLMTTIKGQYFYLYLMMDVFSRKIVGFEVYEKECMGYSSDLIENACFEEGIEPGQISLHSDNGAPMKGSTMLATLQYLGVEASFSRPSVSNDNPFSESLFGTMKERPEYPNKPFETLEKARVWVGQFTDWYNHVHLHSSIGFVTPSDRHNQKAEQLLEKRRKVYQKARCERPERWSKGCRKWEQPKVVYLNRREKKLEPNKERASKLELAA